jgi:NADH dehydrogenase
VSRDFRNITPRCSKVILIEAGERVLPAFSPEISDSAERSLHELGVEVRLGAPVSDIDYDHVQCGKEVIFTRTVIWAAGVKASPAAEWLSADRDHQGRVFVEHDLRVPGHQSIFAIGDTANAPSGPGRSFPAVAPVAKQQGRYVADIILGRHHGDFVYRDYGNLATIGRSRAVIELGGLRLSGFLAWLIWSLAHIWFLIGFRSRLAVTVNWLWSYVTYQRSARLITGEIPLADEKPLHAQPLERKCA